MRRFVTVFLVTAALPLATAAPAYALHKDETVTSGQVTATFSYDYKKTRFGTCCFSGMHLTVDRAGQRLVDQDLGGECEGCTGFPAGSAQSNSIRLIDLDGDHEPEVLIDFYTGGANCCFYSDVWRFDEASGKYLSDVLNPAVSFPYTLKDLNGDGVPEFRSEDYRFAYKYGSNVDTPRPLRIYDWEAGKLVDVTIAYPKLAAREAATLYRAYLKFRNVKQANVRGIMAAYLADSYNARKGKFGWRRVVAAYHRGDFRRKIPGDVGPFGARYLKSLRVFLKKLGYLRRL